jgi:hypothetical protein
MTARTMHAPGMSHHGMSAFGMSDRAFQAWGRVLGPLEAT